ncbi:hypothetical protein PENTCL1PPCAC_19637, partial [Pristionchus entomophagus]
FNILGLPNELISKNFFSCLPIKDRLALVRVNKRLNQIEKESKYFVERLIIEEMSLSKRSPPCKRRRIVGRGITSSFQFNILGLPNELISKHVFSCLPIKDRLALVRVNKRLNQIAMESKYFVERLTIAEVRKIISKNWCGYFFSAHHIDFLDGKSYSSDCIKRIAHNASIGYLGIGLSGSHESHREICNIIKDF